MGRLKSGIRFDRARASFGRVALSLAIAGAAAAFAASWALPLSSANAQDDEVSIHDYAYDPGAIEISAGGSLVFRNGDRDVHTVTSGVDGEANDLFDSGLLQPGEGVRLTFPQAGAFWYFCTEHAFMTGLVIVSEE